jgi:hypothetical protein
VALGLDRPELAAPEQELEEDARARPRAADQEHRPARRSRRRQDARERLGDARNVPPDAEDEAAGPEEARSRRHGAEASRAAGEVPGSPASRGRPADPSATVERGMSREEARELRRPVARPVDPVVEDEVDLGRYGGALLARWWLPLLGLVAGIVVGSALALGGGQAYRAQAVVDLGNPLGPGGGATVQTQASMMAAARETATGEATVRQAAQASGMTVGQVRNGLTTQPLTGGARAAATPLLAITVTGDGPRRVGDAANGIAARVVERSSVYVDRKIALLEERITADNAELETLDSRIDALTAAVQGDGLSGAERLAIATTASALEGRRATLRQSRSDSQQLLSLARNVERARILDQAVPVRTTARSPRNAAIVGGMIGLMLGLLAAIAWDPAAAALRRSRS